MSGFTIVLLTLMGMFFVMKMTRMMMWRSHHHGWRHHGHHRHLHGRRGPDRGRRGRGGWWARAGGEVLKRRLDLDEDQSDIADHAVTDVRRSVRDFVASVKDSRGELAEALRDEALDDARLEVVFDRLQGDLERTRRDIVSAVKQVHAVLDEEQREEAATWLAGARWA